MNSERLRILNLVAERKISADEAADLLEALGAPAADAPRADSSPRTAPKYLRVVVEGGEASHGGRVNVRVPMSLLRAGVRLAALLPPGVHDQINKALHDKGVDLDVSKIKSENLEEIVEQMGELTVDVENGAEKVRVFCE
ncbi:MAG TPA: hypothetical protein VFG53_05830 [Anaeromyxobacter sp.]|nr:hypothetical protein [Anaeromyxobacter sp.]